MNIDDISVEIRTTEKGKMKGVVQIKYLDPEKNGFRLSGFKILTGNYSTGFKDKDENDLWVAPPSFPDQVTGKLINTFFMPEVLWKKLQNKILNQYLRKVGER